MRLGSPAGASSHPGASPERVTETTRIRQVFGTAHPDSWAPRCGAGIEAGPDPIGWGRPQAPAVLVAAASR